jgi:hypothetical protein
MNMDSIATENLAVAYDEILVVDDLDMQIPQGKITAIISTFSLHCCRAWQESVFELLPRVATIR